MHNMDPKHDQVSKGKNKQGKGQTKGKNHNNTSNFFGRYNIFPLVHPS